jgi:hypothetical protein
MAMSRRNGKKLALAHPGDVGAVEQDLPGIGLRQPHDQPRQCGLAASGFAHQPERGVLGDRQADPRHRPIGLRLGQHAALDQEGFRKVLHLEDRRSGLARRARCGRSGGPRRGFGAFALDHRQPVAALAQRRHRIEQCLGIVVLGAAKDLVACRLFEQPAAVHDDHPVGDFVDHAEIVRDQQDRRADLLVQPFEDFQHLALHGHVERRGRLVGDDQMRGGWPPPWRS